MQERVNDRTDDARHTLGQIPTCDEHIAQLERERRQNRPPQLASSSCSAPGIVHRKSGEWGQEQGSRFNHELHSFAT